ncbi:sugar transferase [Paracoccus gahaiensis]|uniref:Sugar transferase n=1 Tax=Paracoccus gahaiensis TaxID=1706839 RepID=A0A4U0RA71_9RHOB|nr:sugar transferase [Paracoccus gahaiensis]TJZ91995.1 sugar transferase [Paracoccus gahaiensis]
MLFDNDRLNVGHAKFVYDMPASEPQSLYTSGGKRFLDTLLVLIAVPIILPIMIVVAAVVMLDGGSPIYSQMRLGRGWKKFRLFKFRTMRPDGDAILAAHLAADPGARAEWDMNQKLRNDPRITRVGRFLRKTSLDELPQLINVLLGSMSLVGPRPMMLEQRVLYPGTYYAAHRPGLTGLWQISARSGSTFAARALYDERYYRELSLRLDLSTIFRTFAVVARCTGC